VARPANATVSISRLIDSVWEEPPARPESNLRTYVSGLRRQMEVAGDAQPRLTSRPGGYSIRVEPGELDLAAFDELAGRGERALDAADFAAAAGWFAQAVELWRGQPLDGLTLGAPIQAELARLDERRLSVLEQHAQARTELGQYEHVITDLRAAVTRHPLRERLWALLMRALHHAGRPAEALHAYAAARRALAEELGTDPSRELRRLHEHLLRGDEHLPPARTRAEVIEIDHHARPRQVDDLTGRTDGSRQRPAGRLGRCMLPRDLPDFTGRQEQLDRLLSMVYAAAETTTVMVIDGMPGSGKTAFAIRLAHRVAGHYPDGQLFIDLHGHSADLPPRSLAAALDMLLAQLGVAPERIPDGVEQRIALWRAETSDRRLLVLLDNAHDASQVEPLVPGGVRCLVLVTGRTRLSGLDGATPLSLGMLGAAEATVMLARIIGDERAAAEPEAVGAVVETCGNLPLAIRLAGARLAHRPQWTVGELARRLRDDSARLATLSVPGRAVEAAFALSYKQLNPSHQHVFAVLGLHPGDDTTADVVSAAGGIPVDRVETALQHLVDVHLVDEHCRGRYRQHDLLRQYSRQLATERDDWRESVERMLEHYLAAAALATRRIGDARPTAAAGFDTTPPTHPRIDTAAEARAWFVAERRNLIEAIRQSVDSGWPHLGQRLAFVAWRFLIGHSSGDSIDTLELGIASAQDTGDVRMEVALGLHLGIAYRQARHRSEAIKVQEGVVATCQRIGDAEIEACATGFLAINQLEQGDLLTAVAGAQHIQELLAEHDAARWPLAPVARILAGWLYGVASGIAGDHTVAAQYLQQALDEATRFGDTFLQAEALAVLGLGMEQADRLDEALERYRQALEVYRETANRHGEATALTAIGRINRRQGNLDTALRIHHTALTVLRHVGDPYAESVLHHELGLALQAAGRVDEAIEHQRHALEQARISGQVFAEGQADAALAALDPATADEHRAATDAISHRLGFPAGDSERTSP